jgi:conjugal transfer pilus assembly protein TraE
MRHAIQKSLLMHLITRRNAFLSIAIISLFTNLILVIAFITCLGKERIILVPPTIEKSFWVENNLVSAEYLSEMSHFFIGLRFNVSPSTAETQREMLLRYVDPSIYEALKTQMLSDAVHINKEHISSVFYPVDIKVQANELKTTLIGDFVSTIGTTTLPAQRVAYEITYGYHEGRLWIKTFNEVITHV